MMRSNANLHRVRRIGEGSWIADDYGLEERTINHRPFLVWVPVGDGHVLRYVDRSYQARVR